MSNPCDPMDCSPPGSSVHGILQVRTLKWVATPSSKGSSQYRNWSCISYIIGRFFTTEPLGKSQRLYTPWKKKKTTTDELSGLMSTSLESVLEGEFRINNNEQIDWPSGFLLCLKLVLFYIWLFISFGGNLSFGELLYQCNGWDRHNDYRKITFIFRFL